GRARSALELAASRPGPAAREAAAAVLLDPFERRNAAALARAHLAQGDARAAQLWARRARAATHGRPVDADEALVRALLEEPRSGSQQDPDELEARARLHRLAGDGAGAGPLDEE